MRLDDIVAITVSDDQSQSSLSVRGMMGPHKFGAKGLIELSNNLHRKQEVATCIICFDKEANAAPPCGHMACHRCLTHGDIHDGWLAN